MSSAWTTVAQVTAASESAVADMLLETQHVLLGMQTRQVLFALGH